MVSILLGAFIVGVASGALLCNRLSKGIVNPALVTVGTLGLSLFAFDLSYASSIFAAANVNLKDIMPGEFLTLKGSMRLSLDLVLIGMFGGLFIVPLNAMVQARTDISVRARVISINNIINSAAFMVGGSLLGILFLTILKWTILEFFVAIAILNIAFMSMIFSKVPEFKSSFILWLRSMKKVINVQLSTKILLGMSAGIIVGLIFNLLGGSDPNSPFLITWIVDNIFDVIGKIFVISLKLLLCPCFFLIGMWLCING